MLRWYTLFQDAGLARLARRLRTSEHGAILALAAALGLAVGLAIWLFREGIQVFHELFVLSLAETALAAIVGPAAIVIALALAGAIVGLIVDRLVGEERHHGVAGVLEAVTLAGGHLPYRRMPAKALASALSLGAGASVGPEDPSVQIGANLGSWFGSLLHLREEQMRLLVAAGAASAIAAAFKAPIAGVFFALEVILNGAFETRAFGVVVLAAVVSSALTGAIEPAPELGRFNYTLGGPLEIPLVIPLGAALALVSVLFMRVVDWQHQLWGRVHLPRPARTALAGALVGLVGIFLPEIMGTGRETMRAILSGTGSFPLATLVAMAGFKVLLTAVSLGGGFVGGIFAPSLFVGTVLGSLYGQLVNTLLPVTTIGDPQAYAIAGMAAAMGGVVRAPITAIMLVFELTNDYRLILPIMLVTVSCVFLTERFEPFGIYTRALLRKGVRLPQGRDIDLMQGMTIGEVMRTPAPTITEEASLLALRDALRQHGGHALCVVDGDGLLCGIVTLSDLQRAYSQARDQVLTVGDICTREVATVSPDAPLWTAVRMMGTRGVGSVPVVRPGTREVVGLIARSDIMRAYNIAIARKLEDQHLAERIRLNTLTGAHVFELYLEPGAPIAGRRICEVIWPPESIVAAIRREGRLVVPHGNTELRAGDVITVVGSPSVSGELAALAHAAGIRRSGDEQT
ncbi:MAG: CBS domain-containing protein [Anaerolineae bacterium]|nr:CBS domain-containing protein [Anaerolineae bacterium]